jgi:hypothetical protein
VTDSALYYCPLRHRVTGNQKHCTKTWSDTHAYTQFILMLLPTQWKVPINQLFPVWVMYISFLSAENSQQQELQQQNPVTKAEIWSGISVGEHGDLSDTGSHSSLR